MRKGNEDEGLLERSPPEEQSRRQIERPKGRDEGLVWRNHGHITSTLTCSRVWWMSLSHEGGNAARCASSRACPILKTLLLAILPPFGHVAYFSVRSAYKTEMKNWFDEITSTFRVRWRSCDGWACHKRATIYSGFVRLAFWTYCYTAFSEKMPVNISFGRLFFSRLWPNEIAR